jgi:hypothetical protein
VSLKPVILLAFSNDPTKPGRDIGASMWKESSELSNLMEKELEVRKLMAAQLGELEEVFLIYKDRLRIFHFAGHGNATHLETEGGATHIEGFAEFVGLQKGVKLVFLNACSTEAQVRYFHQSNIPCVLATTQEIGTDYAQQFARLFYQSLVSGSSLRTSFEEARSRMKNRPLPLNAPALRRSFDLGEGGEAGDGFPFVLHTDPSQLAIEQESLQDWIVPEEKEAPSPQAVVPPAPVSGTKAHLLIDRTVHNKDFEFSVKQSLDSPDRKPQVVVLHGPPDELPDHLADRFYEHSVMNVLRSRNEPLSPGKHHRYLVDFPGRSDFESKMSGRALYQLKENFKQAGLFQVESGLEIAREIGNYRRLVLIQHNLYAEEWHESVPEFLAKYLDDFWNVPLLNRTLHLVLILNLTYHVDQSFWTRRKQKRTEEKIDQALQELIASRTHGLHMERLGPVTQKDLLDWQRKHLKSAPSLVKNVFGSAGSLPMAEVIQPIRAAIKSFQNLK